MKRLTALIAMAALLGLLVGARAAAGWDAPERTASAAGVREPDRLRGGFWRPAGSDATRPVVRLARDSWSPAESAQRRPQPDTLHAVRAVVRLATLD
jgi:hypothetical protein